jgi:hypothetical protein
MANLLDRMKEPTPKNTSRQRKIGPDCLLLLLLLYTFRLLVKGIKLKEKSKRKKKGVRIQAIIGRIRTPDPDSARILIPDPDSNPHLRIRVPVRP